MSDHSVVDEVWQAVDIASDAPVTTEQARDSVIELVEQVHSRLRSVFIGGQEPGCPADWRIDGFEFRRLDSALDEAKKRVIARHLWSKFQYAQRRVEKRAEKARKNEPDVLWFDAGDYETWTKLRQTGWKARMLEVGKKRVYQVSNESGLRLQ